MLRIYALRPWARKPEKGLRKAANGREHGDMGDNIFPGPAEERFLREDWTREAESGSAGRMIFTRVSS